MSNIDFRADPTINEELETPKKLELVDPATGAPIIDETGTPAFLMLYSAQSETFKKRAFKIEGKIRAKMKRHGLNKLLTFEEEREAEAKVYSAAFGEEWNIVRKDKSGKWMRLDVPCTPDNAVLWVLANPLYKTQISNVTDDLSSFIKVNEDGENFTKEASSPSTKASKKD